MERAKILIDNRLRLTLPEGTKPEVCADLEERFTHDNPQFWKLKNLGFPTWKEPRTIKTWEGSRKTWQYSLPRGGLRRVREVLHEHGLPWVIEDRRVDGEGEPDFVLNIPGSKLWDYQERATSSLVQKQNALLRAPTGSGKSTIGMATIAQTKVNTLVVVDTTKLLEQWCERAERELGLHPSDIGVIGAGKFVLRSFTIGLPKTILNRAKDPKMLARMQSFFGSVIVDEVHGAAARTIYETVDAFPARYRIGISADETRKDGKDFLVRDLFGDVAYEIGREDLVGSGHILDVEIRVVRTAFEAEWYGFPDEERELDFNRLLDEMQEDLARNDLALRLAAEEVARGEQVLMLAHRRDHCRVLDAELVARKIPSGFLIGGEDYSQQFDRTKAALISGEVRVGVGTLKAMGQAIDIPALSVGIATTPVASNRQKFNQLRGRFCRIAKGKERAVLYVLWDEALFPRHLENLVRWNPTVRVREGQSWIEAREWMRTEGRSIA